MVVGARLACVLGLIILGVHGVKALGGKRVELQTLFNQESCFGRPDPDGMAPFQACSVQQWLISKK